MEKKKKPIFALLRFVQFGRSEWVMEYSVRKSQVLFFVLAETELTDIMCCCFSFVTFFIGPSGMLASPVT
jgi:hypothetical protein